MNHITRAEGLLERLVERGGDLGNADVKLVEPLFGVSELEQSIIEVLARGVAHVGSVTRASTS